MASPFDRPDELSLMFRARPRDTLRDDLPLLRDESEESLFVLVVDVNVLCVTKSAGALFADGSRIALLSAVVSASSALA